MFAYIIRRHIYYYTQPIHLICSRKLKRRLRYFAQCTYYKSFITLKYFVSKMRVGRERARTKGTQYNNTWYYFSELKFFDDWSRAYSTNTQKHKRLKSYGWQMAEGVRADKSNGKRRNDINFFCFFFPFFFVCSLAWQWQFHRRFGCVVSSHSAFWTWTHCWIMSLLLKSTKYTFGASENVSSDRIKSIKSQWASYTMSECLYVCLRTTSFFSCGFVSI